MLNAIRSLCKEFGPISKVGLAFLLLGAIILGVNELITIIKIDFSYQEFSLKIETQREHKEANNNLI